VLDEYNTAIQAYKMKWDAWTVARKNKALFAELKPSSMAWKTEDLADFDRRFAVLRDVADHIHLAWLNERWLATMHLRDDVRLDLGIEIAVLMQRRPGSTDAVGLDHLDFRSPDLNTTEKLLKQESGITWTREKNGEFCEWLSVWFANTEAKLRPHTKIDVGIAELQAISDRMQKAAA